MEDKIGNIKDEALGEYYKMLIGRVYKLLPMKENDEDKECWKKEKDKLVLELHSGERLFNNSGLYVEIIYNVCNVYFFIFLTLIKEYILNKSNLDMINQYISLLPIQCNIKDKCFVF